MSKPLFRKEAVDAQREKFLGETTVAQPVPMWVFTVMVAIIALLVIAVAVWGQYTRRERVQGYLASETGSVPMLISGAGQVKDIVVSEGQSVTAGTPIALVTVDRTNNSASSSSEAVLRELAQRKASISEERQQTLELGQKQVEQIHKRVADLQSEIAAADAQIALQKTRLQSARDVAQRYDDLAKKQFFSDVSARQKQDDVTDQQIKLQSLMRERATLEKDLAAARLDAPATDLKTRTQIQQLDRQMSSLQQDSAEEATLRETVIRSPIAGTVTNIAVTRGQIVAGNAPLATVIPGDGKLHVELLVPTRAIGFVHTGQAVQLRFEAFPYERFGQYAGKVESVGRTVWMQGDSLGPVSLKEPAYRVIVQMDRQTVKANGEELALRSGMLVSADLLMEKRTLLEWLFQPVLQLRERMK